jgi:hypothetical protein
LLKECQEWIAARQLELDHSGNIWFAEAGPERNYKSKA